MKIKLVEILNFQSFYETIKNKKLPIKTAYKFTKFFNKVDEEIVFYQTKIREISEAYGERDEKGDLVFLEDGRGVKVQESKIAECQKEIQDLTTLEVEIDDISFSTSELEGLELTVEELYPVMSFIVD